MTDAMETSTGGAQFATNVFNKSRDEMQHWHDSARRREACCCPWDMSLGQQWLGVKTDSHGGWNRSRRGSERDVSQPGKDVSERVRLRLVIWRP